MFIFVFIFLCLFRSTMGIYQEYTNISTTTKTTADFINDFISKQTEINNIILMADIYDETLQHILHEDKEYTVSKKLLSYQDTNEEVVKTLNNANRRDGIPGLYILIQPVERAQRDMIGFTEDLRNWGVTEKLCLIFRSKFDKIDQRGSNIYNLYMFTPAAGPVAAFTQYDVCHLCNLGQDTITLVNTWRKDHGFKYQLQLQGSFNGNFHGKSINMGTLNFKPNIHVTGKDENGEVSRDGYVYRKYMFLSDMMNIKWKFYHVSQGNQFELITTNNTPVGLMADLVEGRVDVVGGGWTGTYGRYQHADFTSSTRNFESKEIKNKQMMSFVLVGK